MGSFHEKNNNPNNRIIRSVDANGRAPSEEKSHRSVIWISILSFLAVIAAVIYIFARQFFLSGLPELPDKTQMWQLNLEPNYTLIDQGGEILAHRGPYIGQPHKISDLPQHVPNAFLAIEDERFYEHPGVDRKAILRAFFANTRSGSRGQGGSTLTQQLVKNLVLSSERTYKRKVQEVLLAYDMEQVLSKDEILELYLNRIYMGGRTVGIEAASQKFFGKSAKDITLSEAAILAAIPKAPNTYNPKKNYNAAWKRAQLVLDRMKINEMITPLEAARAKSSPPTISEKEDNYLDDSLIGHVFDFATDRAKDLIGDKHLDLIIEITIDKDRQQYAYDALNKVLKKQGKSKKISEGALLSVDNGSGAIRAMIGGSDYAQSKFNRAIQAKRQPGSSFKTFVYAAALEQGLSVGTVRIDRPTTIHDWSPENYTKRFHGPMTLREALKLSINTIAAQVGAEIGPSKVAILAKRFGIRTELRETYSLALGSSEVTLKEMVEAYMVFPNIGRRRALHMVSSIKTTSGEELYNHDHLSAERVYSKTYARQITKVLQDVIETGTGYGAQIDKRELGGKTGTSQDYRDAWFMGFSNQITTGVWLGNDDNSPMNDVTGGLLPVDIWKDYMSKAHKGLKNIPLMANFDENLTPSQIELRNFYTNLSEAMIAERNLAAGITSVPN